MESPHGSLGRLQIVGVGDGLHESSHHLRAVHDGVPAGLLLTQLMDHHGSLAHNNLVLIIQKFDQLGNSSGGKISIILVVDQVHYSMLQHLAWFRESLNSCRLGWIQLGRGNLKTLIQSLWEHRSSDSLAPGGSAA